MPKNVMQLVCNLQTGPLVGNRMSGTVRKGGNTS